MSAPANATSASPLEAELLRIRAMLEANQMAPAFAAAELLLTAYPDHRDVLYMLAVSQRCLGRLSDALSTLARLELSHPEYSRLYQERGRCFGSAQHPAAAIEAYLRAVHLNPALLASWKALESLLREAGRVEEANEAAAQLASWAAQPQPIVVGSSMLADGDVAGAEQVVRQFLRRHGDHVEGMRLLARIGIKLDVLDDAELLYESILVLAPELHVARYEYAQVLLLRHKNVRALEETGKLLAINPLSRDYRALQASILVALGSFEQGLEVYRELAVDAPRAADIHLSIGHLLKTLGRQRESIAAYRMAAEARANFGDAYWSLANLKTYRFSNQELERMRTAEASRATQRVDRYHLCFALGKAYEDREEFAESFACYARGNALKKSESRYRIDPIARIASLQKSVCTREFFDQHQGVGCQRTDPIFIVGLPRSGSTLIEQILASHSQVEGTMELPDVQQLVGELQGRRRDPNNPRYPGVLATLDAGEFQRMGEKYLADTAVYRTGKPYFIDKMPNNFRHLGLIHLILPNARIIDARREPMACCFSNFKQLFAAGQEFTYAMADIAAYYRLYIDLMEHWNSALPGKILRVQHEDLVRDLEGHVRRLLEFCGLPFEPACLEFYRNDRSVRTASSEQVRRPIFKESLNQWRNFEPWLAPLREALGPLAAGGREA